MSDSTRPPSPPTPRALSGLLMTRYIEEMRLRNYSPRSVRTYAGCLRRFVEYFAPAHPRDLSSEQIRGFLLDILETGRSRSLIDQYISALRLLYVDLYRRPPDGFAITRPRREQKLPYVPTRAEILEMARVVTNRKHHLAILFLYSTGLRVSELVRADVADLAGDRLSFRVRNGKGAKDRRTVVSPRITPELDWITHNRPPDTPLFPSRAGGRWSARSVQRVVSAAGVKAQIEHRVSCHSLRHAFATHLLESGTQLFYIQGLLGHKSIATTTRYTRMVDPASASIRSPL